MIDSWRPLQQHAVQIMSTVGSTSTISVYFFPCRAMLQNCRTGMERELAGIHIRTPCFQRLSLQPENSQGSRCNHRQRAASNSVEHTRCKLGSCFFLFFGTCSSTSHTSHRSSVDRTETFRNLHSGHMDSRKRECI